MGIAFVNGDYLNASDAKVSIFDRGFLFGDSIYEVLPVYNGQPFFADQHIARLKSNLEKIKIDTPDIDWNLLISSLIKENGGGNLQIYIQVTRGNQGARKHDIPPVLKPSVIAFTIHNPYPSSVEFEKGLSARLVEDIRWDRCDIKTTSLLANIMLNDEAVRAGYQTAILVRDGFISEGSTSNIFIVTQEGTIKTPPLNNHCLPGITRQIAIDLIKQHGWTLEETEFHVDELFSAAEVWISSTTKEIFPVTTVDGTLINNGQIGNFWRKLNQSYYQLIK